MEKLLQAARKRGVDGAEVYYTLDDVESLVMRKGDIEDIESTIQCGYALRVIKDGMIGSAYTTNLLDRDELVANALASLEGKVGVGFDFPGPERMPDLDLYDPAVEDVSFRDLERRARDTYGHLSVKTTGQVDVYTGILKSRTRVMNTSGLSEDLSRSVYYMVTSLLFPNTETSVGRSFRFRAPTELPDHAIDEQLMLYNAGLEEADPEPGRMKVLFTPNMMYTLFWRLGSAANARAIYDETSPLSGKTGERIVSEKVTVYCDPLDSEHMGATPFDDEGVATKRFDLVEKGVFRSCYNNLDYASKLGMEPTGTGFRQSMWGGQAVAQSPTPFLNHPRVATGEKSFEELLAEMDRGVIVLGVLGAHSGNILNGDFSVGLNPGLYVENGQITGRITDGMIAGNVYDLLKNVAEIEDRIHEPHGRAHFPCILFDDVSVTCK